MNDKHMSQFCYAANLNFNSFLVCLKNIFNASIPIHKRSCTCTSSLCANALFSSLIKSLVIWLLSIPFPQSFQLFLNSNFKIKANYRFENWTKQGNWKKYSFLDDWTAEGNIINKNVFLINTFFKTVFSFTLDFRSNMLVFLIKFE